jgi:HlyD family secretion protein
MKKVLIRIIILAVVLGAAWGGYRLFQQMPQRQQQVATTKVRRGDVVVRSFARGELRAVRSSTLVAPNLFGTVQVTRLAALGAFAREKDLVVEFDDSEVRSRLEEKELELEQLEEQIKKSRADLAISANQDQVELLRTRYAVRRAELEVKRNELISKIDAQKNLLTLEEARRRLKQFESDIKSRQVRAEAELAVLQERKNKANLEMARELQRLSQVKLLSPMSGLVAVRQNFGGSRMFGMALPDIREGDQVSPGLAVADVLDLSELEVNAKVGELDRANLREGQDVMIALDAIPEKKFHGQIKSMSGTASANFFSADPAKKFDVTFSIDMRELLKELGSSEDQIRRVLATAEQNRKKPPMVSMSPIAMMSGMLGGAPGGMPEMGAPSDAGGAPGAPEAAAGGGRRSKSGGSSSKTSSGTKKGETPAPGAAGGPPTILARGPEGKSGERKGGERKGGDRKGGDDGMLRLTSMYGSSQFSEKDLANAKLPPPPEEDSQLEMLIRPGLLSDVEIIVEKIPNAIHIPNQAVFEKNGKLIAYVLMGPGKWEERVLKPLKRSESTLVVGEGLKPGETIALADPYEKPGDKKKKQDSSSSGGGGNPMGGMPSGGKGGK